MKMAMISLLVLPVRPFMHPLARQRSLITRAMSAATATSSKRPVVVLSRGKARMFRDGEMLVYGGAVSHVEPASPELTAGTLVDVSDGAGNILGWGPYNHDSMFRVRLLWMSSETKESGASLGALLLARVRSAVLKRRRIGLPNESTDAYRLVNSEVGRPVLGNESNRGGRWSPVVTCLCAPAVRAKPARKRSVISKTLNSFAPNPVTVLRRATT